MSDLATSVTRDGHQSTVAITGEVNRSAAAPLQAAWAEATSEASTVVIDFREMSYLNSSGIAVLVGLLADARVNGVVVIARGLDDHFRHVFEITRISDLMQMENPR